MGWEYVGARHLSADCTRISMYIYTCVFVCVCVCTHTYIYTYIYTYHFQEAYITKTEEAFLNIYPQVSLPNAINI